MISKENKIKDMIILIVVILVVFSLSYYGSKILTSLLNYMKNEYGIQFVYVLNR